MSTDLAVSALFDALAAHEPVSAAWAKRQYEAGLLAVDIDRDAGIARLAMDDLPTIEVALP